MSVVSPSSFCDAFGDAWCGGPFTSSACIEIVLPDGIGKGVISEGWYLERVLEKEAEGDEEDEADEAECMGGGDSCIFCIALLLLLLFLVRSGEE